MDLYEYQARELFEKNHVPVLRASVLHRPEQWYEHAHLFPEKCVLKAQVKVGGRGKAGGVKVAKTPQEAFDIARNIFGMSIKGHTVGCVMVTEAVDIAHECYIAFLLDRASGQHMIMVSAQGGVDIEHLAQTQPDALTKIMLNPCDEFTRDQAIQALERANIPQDFHERIAPVVCALYQTYTASDALLVEVNPLGLTRSGDIFALDGKVTLDDNAAFRHDGWQQFQDNNDVDEREIRARGERLNYVKLDGQVGVIGNGAGLVMSTLDVVAYEGEKYGEVQPANFLDIGGGASSEVMAAGLDLVMSDPQVTSVFVNVFGGITSCAAVAQGIVGALETLGDRAYKPIVVRLDGNAVREGRGILEQFNHPLVTFADTMDAGADRATQLASPERKEKKRHRL